MVNRFLLRSVVPLLGSLTKVPAAIALAALMQRDFVLSEPAIARRNTPVKHASHPSHCWTNVRFRISFKKGR
jgi:hypothetical protein